MKILMFALALVLPASAIVQADRSVDPILSTYQVYNVEKSAMDQIAEKFEVVRKIENGYEVYVPADRASELMELAPQHRLIEEDNSFDVRKMGVFSTQRFGLRQGRDYHTYPQVLEKLKQLSETHPEYVQLEQYGTSQQGRPLVALKLSDNVSQDEDEPELMITSATHGDEIITTEVVLNLIDKLVNGYNVDARLTKMITDHELYFIPVVNADGFSIRSRFDNGRDPNRSYPWPEDEHAKPTASIAALIEFFKSREFVGSLDFHAYGMMTMYPWAYTYESVPQKDRDDFETITSKMAATNGHEHGPISKVIYVAKGSSADYYYWTKGTKAIAIEVGTQKAPNPNQIEKYTNQQTESTWLFIESF